MNATTRPSLDGILTDAATPNAGALEQPAGCCAGCDNSRCAGVTLTVPDVDGIVERWHNETHAGAYRFCDLDPCRPLRAAAWGE